MVAATLNPTKATSEMLENPDFPFDVWANYGCIRDHPMVAVTL